MLLRLICIGLLLFPLKVGAHPAWGIAFDGAGNLYFADALHNGGCVWRLDRNGHLTQSFEYLHAHSLWADRDARIWAAQSDFEVDAQGRESWLNELLWLRKDGDSTRLISTRDNAKFYGAMVAADDRERVYFASGNRIQGLSVAQNPADRILPVLPQHEFSRLVSLYAGLDGCLYAADNGFRHGTLYRIDPGDAQMTIVAEFLLDLSPTDPPFPEPRFNLLFGIAQDPDFNLYIANSGSRCIIKIAPDDTRSTFYTSQKPWYPVGIAFGENRIVVKEAGYDSRNIGPRLVERTNDSWRQLLILPE